MGLLLETYSVDRFGSWLTQWRRRHRNMCHPPATEHSGNVFCKLRDLRLFSQDVILPFVCDIRFPEDTLWIVMEEDMEFCPPQTDMATFVKATCKPSKSPDGSRSGRVGSAISSSMPSSSSSGPAVPKGEPFASRGTQPFQNELVSDIVKLCTMAWTEGCGDFIWLGFNPPDKDKKKQTRTPKFSYGSQCIALNRRAALSLRSTFGTPGWKPAHVDQTLKAWCRDSSLGLRACWVWPPVGSFRSHESECDPTWGEREGGWSETLVRCPFVRPAHDQHKRNRELFMFQKKGAPEAVVSVPNSFFEDPEAGLWLTFADGDLRHPDGSGARHKRDIRRQKISTSLRVWTNSRSKVSGKTE